MSHSSNSSDSPVLCFATCETPTNIWVCVASEHSESDPDAHYFRPSI